MQFYQIILISLQIMGLFSKKYVSSSEESIENLLYFQDCQTNKNDGTSTLPPPIQRLRAPQPKAMDCPFPKMCCSISCGGNECGSPTSPFLKTGQDSMAEQVFPPIRPLSAPIQPPVQPSPSRARKKKAKQPKRLKMAPIPGSRRDFGFTKDRIKSLINQDDDIRKILKDLVRVTMQKVDLVDKIHAKRQGVSASPPLPTPRNSVNDDYDYDLE